MPAYFTSPFTTTASPKIDTLSLHDALPIYRDDARDTDAVTRDVLLLFGMTADEANEPCERELDRKSTRLNSSHPSISYAVFCVKKKFDTAVLMSHLIQNAVGEAACIGAGSD